MPVRIALLTNFIPPYLVSLYQELERRCVELRIFLSAKSETGRLWPLDWADLPVRLQRSLSLPRKWKHPHNFQERVPVHIPYDTIPQLVNFRPDVMLSREMGMRTLQAAIYRRCVPESRLIIWATISEVSEKGRGRMRRWLRRRLFRAADAVIVSGESGARYVQQFGVDSCRTFHVPFTTNMQPFLDTPHEREPARRHRLIFSGMLVPRKGLLPFLDVLARWASEHRHRFVDFDIAGEGPLRSAIEAYSCPRNLKVRLLGHIQYEDLPKVYRRAGILVFPTLADDWGLVVTEAMAAALPVLGSSYSQAVEELVKDGANGWIFRPDQTTDMAGALERALSASLEQLNNMGSNARETVRELTPAAVADRVMAAVAFAKTSGSSQ